jgi:transposase
MRQLIVTRAQQGWTYARIAEALGISVRTVAKWIARSRQGGELRDGSSRPHRQPARLAPLVEAAILALRRTRATAWQISTALQIPRSTVTCVLARAGLNRIALLAPAEPAGTRRRHWASHPRGSSSPYAARGLRVSAYCDR